MGLKRLFVILLAALALLSQSGLARADDKEEAKRHFDIGISLISGEPKDYAGALVEFQTSVRLYPTKTGLYNLGLCYRRLARYGEALETFARLKREFGHTMSDSLKQDVDWEVAAIERLTVRLTIVVNQPGATITLNGETIGTSPLPKPLILGPREYRLRVDLLGFQPVLRKLSLASGQRHVERVELEPLAAQLMVTTHGTDGASILVDGKLAGMTPLTSPLSIPAGHHMVTVTKDGYEGPAPQSVFLQGGGSATLTFQLFQLPPPVEPTREPEPDHGAAMLDALPWIGAGLTVTAGVFAGALVYQAEQRHEDFTYQNDRVASGEIRSDDPAAAGVDASRQQAADDTETYGAAAIGAGITAGVFAVATIVLFVVDPGGGDGEDRAVAVHPNGMSIQF